MGGGEGLRLRCLWELQVLSLVLPWASHMEVRDRRRTLVCGICTWSLVEELNLRAKVVSW